MLPFFLPVCDFARQPPPFVLKSVDGAVVCVSVVEDEAVEIVVVSVVEEEAVDAVVVAADESVDVVDVSVVADEVVDATVDVVLVSVVDEDVVDAVVEAAVDIEADDVVDDAVAQTIAVVGSVVKGVTVKSGVPPCDQVQHGSPNAAPLVMSELGKVSAQKSAVQESPTASKAVAKSVY
ncbi:hypothetical protein P3T76_009646 [Phytophthora citrophthora]|uniref:Uncharacterized protein n=1 Tax=Phytophthora citrophthora TaxID=4793 RepID=A0AAD9GGB7_9STRA|nr:hypothetical protein P3T76_009646 [Phytophthora citrophthora]